MLCPLHTGPWSLMRGSVYTMSTIYRAVEPDEGGLYMPCPLYTGPWGLMRGFVYAMSTMYRPVGPDEGVCICYVQYIQGFGA